MTRQIEGWTVQIREELLATQRDATEKRGAPGPRLLLAGLVDDGGPKAFGHVTASTPEEGRGIKDFRDYAERLAEDEANEIFTYSNLKGEEKSLVRGQAILHVVNHATLHRGQVIALLRQLGKTPPATDLLFFYLR